MKRFTILIKKVNNLFWMRVSSSADVNVQSLTVFRILTGVFLILILNKHFDWLSYLPEAFFLPPPSFLFFFSKFPGYPFFMIADILLFLSSICILYGIKPRIACYVYIVVGMCCYNFMYSIEKISHSILLFVFLFCLSFSGWGKMLAILPDRNSKWDSAVRSLSLLSVIICFAFFTAGWDKSLSWINLDLNKSGVGFWYYTDNRLFSFSSLLASYIPNLPFWSLKFMDFAAVFLELSPFFFLLHSKKAWRLWLLFAAIFHIINVLFLNIAFIWNFIVYIVFIDYSDLYIKMLILFKSRVFKIITTLAVIMISVLFLFYEKNGIYRDMFFITSEETKTGLYLSLIVWLFTAIMLLSTFIKKTEKQTI